MDWVEVRRREGAVNVNWDMGKCYVSSYKCLPDLAELTSSESFSYHHLFPSLLLRFTLYEFPIPKEKMQFKSTLVALLSAVAVYAQGTTPTTSPTGSATTQATGTGAAPPSSTSGVPACILTCTGAAATAAGCGVV
jgi:hypothetical protein